MPAATRYPGRRLNNLSQEFIRNSSFATFEFDCCVTNTSIARDNNIFVSLEVLENCNGKLMFLRRCVRAFRVGMLSVPNWCWQLLLFGRILAAGALLQLGAFDTTVSEMSIKRNECTAASVTWTILLRAQQCLSVEPKKPTLELPWNAQISQQMTQMKKRIPCGIYFSSHLASFTHRRITCEYKINFWQLATVYRVRFCTSPWH